MPTLKEYASRVGCCFGGCCCPWGSVRLSLQLQRSGFIPGETVCFITDIANRSTKTCTVNVSLIEVGKLII